MKKTTLIVHQNYVEDVIKKLHETGLMEIINISKNEPEFLENNETPTISPEAEICANYELRLSRIIDILNRIKPKKTGLKAFLYPELLEKKTVEDRPLEEIYSNIEGVLAEIENQIIENDKKITELNQQIDDINSDIIQLNYLKDFGLDISDVGESEYLFIKTGKTKDIEKLREQINVLEKVDIFSKQFSSGKKIEWAVVVVGHISEKNMLEKICRENISEFTFNVVSSGLPKNLVKSLEIQKKNIENEKEKISASLQGFAEKQLSELLALREEIQLERIRLEVAKNFGKTYSTYVINGWILEKAQESFRNILESVAKGFIDFDFKTPSVNPDNPPTYIETPRWAEGFKGLLSMFAIPKYNEINPTILMGFFFILFFGVMLGDAGYGLVILFLSVFGYIKLGKNSEMLRSWSFMGVWMGIVTTVFGLLTNSFFGDFVPRFFYGDPTLPLYSLNLGGVHLPLNSIKDPLTILTIALVFGLIHLNLGVLLGIYQAYKHRKYKEMLTARFCWIPLQLGGGLLISNFILNMELSTVLFYVAVVLVLVGIIQLFISTGPIGFFDVTGYVGDWLSYARLLALGLATTGMALAFNVISQLMGNMIPFVGIVVMIILLILAHTVNLGLQSLGAAIHSLRLQYVEFFNRFYEGGGHEFSLVKIKRKYTRKIEERIE